MAKVDAGKRELNDDERWTSVSVALDKVQEKQIVVVEVYGEPLNFDEFLDALHSDIKRRQWNIMHDALNAIAHGANMEDYAQYAEDVLAVIERISEEG